MKWLMRLKAMQRQSAITSSRSWAGVTESLAISLSIALPHVLS